MEVDKELEGGNHIHFEGATLESTYSKDSYHYTNRYLCDLGRSFSTSKNFGMLQFLNCLLTFEL